MFFDHLLLTNGMSVIHQVHQHFVAAQHVFCSEESQGEWAALSPNTFDKDAVFVIAENILPFYQEDFWEMFLGGRKNHEVKYGFMKGMHFVT